jgi:membrane fusion protein, multidrug efflux system
MTESAPAPDGHPRASAPIGTRAARSGGWLGARSLAGALLAAVAIAISAWWVYDRLHHVYITDARIAATMITISSRVPGWLQDLGVETGDRVRRGDLLLVIDDREAALALEEAELGIAKARAAQRQVEAERTLRQAAIESSIARARAEVRAAESVRAAADAEVERVRAEWQRAQSLLERAMISRELFEQQQTTHLQAEQRLLSAVAGAEAAVAALAEAEAARFELEVLDARLEHAAVAVRDAEARRDQLEVALSHHRIRSPVDAVIDAVFVEPGEYVERGRQLLILHDPSTVWVTANVRETQIRHVRPGAAVRVRVDAYPGREFPGVVRRVGHAATSQFALLPNPNPSGNFTKITQRIEVRIDLEQDQERLMPGMMVEVKIGI